jgi:hypothetical protein
VVAHDATDSAPLRRGISFARRATIRAGRNAPWQDVVAGPRRVDHRRVGVTARANVMRLLFEDIGAAIAIAVCTFAISKTMWFGLGALF